MSRRSGTCASILLLVAFCAADASSSCELGQAERQHAAEVIQQMLNSLAAGDEAGFRRTTTPDFMAIDAGARLNGLELMEAVKASAKSGSTYSWTVTKATVRLSCNSGWATYDNDGWKRHDRQAEHRVWLESVDLARVGGLWKVRFFHSSSARQ